MKDAQFTFIPVRSKAKIQRNDGPVLSIFKPGIVNIRTYSAIDVGFDLDRKKQSIKLVFDEQKRALGFQLTDEVGSKNDGYRIVTVIRQKKYPGSFHVSFSACTVMNLLQDVPLPLSGVPIKKYVDHSKLVLSDKPIWYIQLPRTKKVEKKLTDKNESEHEEATI